MTRANTSMRTAAIAADYRTCRRPARVNGPAIVSPVRRRPALWAGLGLSACVLWSCWPILRELIRFWQQNQDYSVGMLVPPVAACLAWQQRRLILEKARGIAWWGLGMLLISQVVRFVALYYGYRSIERLSIVLTISSGILLLGGWRVFRGLIWIQVFLLLMLPFPNRLHNLISPPLQAWATTMGRYDLELLGFFVQQEGNVLHVEEQTTVAVAEACSGLRMLTAFIVTSAVFCFLVKRPVWQKVLLLATSVPIAVICNGVRVLATSLFIYYAKNPELGERFHDAAGLLMMPLAILILITELKLLGVISVPVNAPQLRRRAVGPQAGSPVPVALGRSTPGGPAEPTCAQTSEKKHIRSLMVSAVVAGMVLLAAGFGHRTLVSRIERAISMVAKPKQPLASLPLELGDWHGTEVPIDRQVLKVAWFDDDYVNRAYQDRRTGTSLGVFVGYVGRPRTRFGHRPDVCYAAFGWEQVMRERRAITSASGGKVPCILYEFRKPKEIRRPLLVLSTFVINGGYLEDPEELDRWQTRNPGLLGEKAAYLTRIQVSVVASDDRDNDLRSLEDFVGQVVRPVSQCMPY